MSRYQGTLLPSELEDKKIETETRKAVLDLLKKINEVYAELLPESGSNDNGSFIKFFDGTMIQNGSSTITTNTVFAPNFYASSSKVVDFPVKFVGVPISVQVSPAPVLSVGSAFLSRIGGSTGVTSERFAFNVWMSDNATTYTVYWTAYGKWK